jgi:hypothetical protein
VAHTPCSPRPFGPTGPSPARAFPPSSLCPGGPARQRGHFPRACAHSPALSTRGPPLSVPSSPCNRRPSCAYRSLRAHVAREARNRPALGHLSPRASLTLSPLICAPAEPLFNLPHAARTPERRRRCPPPSRARFPSTSEPRRALRHGELRLDVRNSGHAPISPVPP